jgi:ubiquinone/menaquinone biosynthesis C-methylase UbiE
MTSTEVPPASSNRGVVHWAARYDLLLTLVTLGRESTLRERLLDLAQLAPGESVLDVGCGTGTLAIAAKRRVGNNAAVHGIDASAEMIARAAKKATREKVHVTFDIAFAESLPFPDTQFDVVLSTVMLHHLRRAVREQCVREMHRVLKSGGRLLIVDFGRIASKQRGLMAHFHRHGRVELSDLVGLTTAAGLDVVDRGEVGFGNLLFVLGRAGPRDMTNLDARKD